MFLSTRWTDYIGAVAQALAAAGAPPLTGWCTPDDDGGFLAWNAGHTAPAHWPHGLALCWHHEHGWSWADQEAEILQGRLPELAVDAAPADVAAVAIRLLADHAPTAGIPNPAIAANQTRGT